MTLYLFSGKGHGLLPTTQSIYGSKDETGNLPVPVLILTDGADGSCVHTVSESLYAVLPSGCGGPYGVGCGDAFFGGYLSAWSEGLSMEDKIRRANACGISNSRALRCGAVDAEEVRRLENCILIRS